MCPLTVANENDLVRSELFHVAIRPCTPLSSSLRTVRFLTRIVMNGLGNLVLLIFRNGRALESASFNS